MRILYIITQGEQGGAQKHVLDLAKGMKEKGHDVYIATGVQRQEKDKWLFESLQEKGISKEKLFELKNHAREINVVKDIQSVFEILKLLKKVRPDILHLHSSKAGFTGALAGLLYNLTPPVGACLQPTFKKGRNSAKIIYTVHGFVFLEPMNTLKKYFYILLEFLSSFIRDFTILISEKDISVGKKFFILRQVGFYKLIYNGIDEGLKNQILSREEAKKYILEKIPAPKQVQIVGTISNLYKTKGLEFLIDAAKKIVEQKQNVTFVVFGSGDEKYKTELVKRLKKNNLENNFFFLGKTEKAFKYLRGLDVFTLTSVKEGMPYCLLEAGLAGVPIVASAVGGIPEMAKNFEMDLVEVGDVSKIAEKILTNLGRENKDVREFPKIYSLENMLDEIEKVYKNLIK